MARKYLITFAPINRFFFGSSSSFAEGFYVSSMKYPQPTTILGCLRHTILMQYDVVKKAGNRVIPDIGATETEKLTGTSKLEGLNDTDANFGIIEKVSPVFIVKQSTDRNGVYDALFPTPDDVVNRDGKLFRYSYEKRTGALSSYSGQRKDFAVLSEKGAKERSANHLGGTDFWNDYCSSGDTLSYRPEYDEEKVFIKDTSVGIGRENRVASEGMFYTKIDYTLSKGFSFAALIWINEDELSEGQTQSDLKLEEKLKDLTVVLGGEQSPFRLSIKKLPQESAGIFADHPILRAIINDETDLSMAMASASGQHKVVSISPLVFSKSISDNLEHAIIGDVKTTRVLMTERVGSVRKSNAFCMIPVGSVIYPSNVGSTVDDWAIPRKIGYNAVIKVKRGDEYYV